MRRFTCLAAISAVALAGIGLALPSPATAQTHHAPLISPATGLPLGMMPTTQQRARAQAQAAKAGGSTSPINTTANNKLQYFGGPIISNPDVVSVLWDSTAGTRTDQPGIDSFFAAILRSQYFSWLKEYDTPGSPNGTGQHSGYGSFRTRVTWTPTDPTDHDLQDTTDIQAQLLAGLTAGTIPAPTTDADGNPNTIYAIFFPSNDVIHMGTSTSGVQFCAYHGSTNTLFNGMHVPYAVLPDPTATGISAGCGAGTATQNLQSYASHEISEAANDTQVAQATVFGPPLAWYDQVDGANGGEISDLCNQVTGTITGGDGGSWLVQKNWSNSQGACIANRTKTLPAAAENLTVTPTVGGGMHVSWQEPVDDGYSPILSYEIYRSGTSGDTGTSLGNFDWTHTSIDDTPPSDGTWYYQVFDSNDNLAGVGGSQVSGTSDGTPPTAAISPTGGSFKDTVPVTVTASDANGVDYVEFQVNGDVVGSDFTSPFGTNIDISGLPEGPATLGVRAFDTTGNASTLSTAIIQVDNTNTLPTANFGHTPSSPLSKVSTAFTASATDPDSTIASYSWKWGDGTAASSGKTPHHTFAKPGTYAVKLTVLDSDGGSTSISHNIVVRNRPPTASFTWTPTKPHKGQSAAFTATATDPDGTIAGYKWTWGDGTSSTGKTPSHKWAHKGTFTVKLTVTDNKGAKVTITHSVTVRA